MRPLDLGAVLVGALALAMVSGAGAQRAAGTLLAAHRGGAALWPENSLLAFKNATALGADFLEFDVHLSKDGEVIVIHDPTLDRTTTGTGPAKAKTLAELRELKLKDRAQAVTDERIPTLDEVVALAAANRRQLLLEIKIDADKQRYPGIEERVFAILDRHAMVANTVVMAFEAETWQRVRALRPDARAGALYSARALTSPAAVAKALSDAGTAGVAFVGLGYALVTPEAVAEARRAGVALGAWTVNEPDAIRLLLDRGVGVLITDRPDAAKDLMTQRRTP